MDRFIKEIIDTAFSEAPFTIDESAIPESTVFFLEGFDIFGRERWVIGHFEVEDSDIKFISSVDEVLLEPMEWAIWVGRGDQI